jgi:hypothetical protein
MNRMFEHFEDRARDLALLSQPIIIAMGSAGVTGGAMAAAGMLASKLARGGSNFDTSCRACT